MELGVARNAEHWRRKVLLERLEKKRAEIQLEIVVALRRVILVRVQPQPARRVVSEAPGNDAVPVSDDRRSVALLPLLQRTVPGHGSAKKKLQELSGIKVSEEGRRKKKNVEKQSTG